MANPLLNTQQHPEKEEGEKSPKVEVSGTEGRANKKFVIAGFPSPRETPKRFSARTTGLQDAVATISYKRGDGAEKALAWDGVQANVKFENGILNCLCTSMCGRE
jgi:hypothetical protein